MLNGGIKLGTEKGFLLLLLSIYSKYTPRIYKEP